MLAQLARGQQAAQSGQQSVVVSLGRRAVIAAYRVLVGCLVHDWGVVVGVTGAGGGEFGEHGFDGGPQLGGDQTAQA